MTTASLTRRLAIAAVSALAMVTVADTSAVAGTTILDPSGVDYDAACLVRAPLVLAPAPPPNSIASPFGVGCPGVSSYDGSTESTDIRSVSLSTNGVRTGSHSNTQLVASCTLDGPIPPAGSATLPFGGADLPHELFSMAGCKVMFQNSTRQTNAPYVAGCRVPLCTPIFGLNEHWGDGFHFWIGFDMNWNGGRWVHSAKIGTYDPSPTGGFLFQELGVSTSSGLWNAADPACMPYGAWNVAYGPGNKVTVTVDGVSRFSSILAIGGCLNGEHVKAGDNIINVKGLSSADVLAVLPLTVPTSIMPGFADITAVGGFMFFSDATEGNSRNEGIVGTLLQRKILGISYTPGLAYRAMAGEWLDVRPDRELWGVGASTPDTLGHGPGCWTYTLGGTLPTNPLWRFDEPCHIDDHVIPGPNGNVDPGLGRGSILPEFWDTNFGFIA